MPPLAAKSSLNALLQPKPVKANNKLRMYVQSDIWLQGLGTEGQFSAGGGDTPQLPGQGRTDCHASPNTAAWPEPQPGQKITHVLTQAEILQNNWKKQRLPNSDKTELHCKITLPRLAYATDQNCQVIPVLPLEQKICTCFTCKLTQLLTALDLSSTACPQKKHSKNHSSSRPRSEEFLQLKTCWPTPDHGIVESTRLEKAFKITESNH